MCLEKKNVLSPPLESVEAFKVFGLDEGVLRSIFWYSYAKELSYTPNVKIDYVEHPSVRKELAGIGFYACENFEDAVEMALNKKRYWMFKGFERVVLPVTILNVEYKGVLEQKEWNGPEERYEVVNTYSGYIAQSIIVHDNETNREKYRLAAA